MVSSLSVGCPGNNSVVVDHAAKLSIENRCSLRPLSVKICDQSRSGRRKGRISAAAATAAPPMPSSGLKNRMSLELYEGGRKDQRRGNDAVNAHERLDNWMRESVVEIVKNLREAPLLVQVYPKKKGDSNGGEATTLMTGKKAVVEDWPVVKDKWEAGETPLPEGIIFVEELAEEAEREGNGKDGTERTTRAWGVVVQGKGAGCGPVCYLLKTSRVGPGPGSGSGMGHCCTHFCLTKVKSLRETVESQLKNCWLLQSQ